MRLGTATKTLALLLVLSAGQPNAEQPSRVTQSATHEQPHHVRMEFQQIACSQHAEEHHTGGVQRSMAAEHAHESGHGLQGPSAAADTAAQQRGDAAQREYSHAEAAMLEHQPYQRSPPAPPHLQHPPPVSEERAAQHAMHTLAHGTEQGMEGAQVNFHGDGHSAQRVQAWDPGGRQSDRTVKASPGHRSPSMLHSLRHATGLTTGSGDKWQGPQPTVGGSNVTDEPVPSSMARRLLGIIHDGR